VSRYHALSARGSGDMGSTSSHRLRAAQGAQSRAEPHRAAQNLLQMVRVAINKKVTYSTGTHLDLRDSRYNCVVRWGKYKGGLVLW
jgi:hypothetical protein